MLMVVFRPFLSSESQFERAIGWGRGRKRDPKGIVGIAIFLPVLCGRRISENECHKNKDDQRIFHFPSVRSAQRRASQTLDAINKIRGRHAANPPTDIAKNCLSRSLSRGTLRSHERRITDCQGSPADWQPRRPWCQPFRNIGPSKL